MLYLFYSHSLYLRLEQLQAPQAVKAPGCVLLGVLPILSDGHPYLSVSTAVILAVILSVIKRSSVSPTEVFVTFSRRLVTATLLLAATSGTRVFSSTIIEQHHH